MRCPVKLPRVSLPPTLTRNPTGTKPRTLPPRQRRRARSAQNPAPEHEHATSAAELSRLLATPRRERKRQKYPKPQLRQLEDARGSVKKRKRQLRRRSPKSSDAAHRDQQTNRSGAPYVDALNDNSVLLQAALPN